MWNYRNTWNEEQAKTQPKPNPLRKEILELDEKQVPNYRQ